MFLIFLSVLFAQSRGLLLREATVPKLIIISYSGFRYDYFAHNATPFLNTLRATWGDVKYSKGEYVRRKNSRNATVTSEYFSASRDVLASDGLHEEVGQVNTSLQMLTYGQDALPIWIVNELSGGNRSSGLMMWPGGDLAINGTQATYVMFNENENWTSRIDVVVSWFKDPQRPINLAMLNFEGPDLHSEGDLPLQSLLFDDSLRRLDNATKYLYDQLFKNNLTDVNVIHLSDRTMIDISRLRVINITGIIGNEHYKVVGSASAKIIEPEEDNAIRIYEKLQESADTTRGFQVYWKEESPGLEGSQRIQVKGIVVIAKPGYAFEEAVTNYEITKTSIDINITHEFHPDSPEDNNDNDAGVFFFATGPAFEKNCLLGPLPDDGDLYPLVCQVLNIDCYGMSQEIQSFEKCIKEIENQSSYDVFLVVLTSMAIFLAIVATITIFAVKRRRWQQTLDLNTEIPKVS